MHISKRAIFVFIVSLFLVSASSRVVMAQEAFTVTPTAVGEAEAAFLAKYIDFSYVALVDQTATGGTGSFSEQGAGFFGSFRYPTLSDVVFGTGLTNTYNMYLKFDATGTVAPNGSGGLNITFTTFNATLWVDKDGDTTIVTSNTGAPDGTVVITDATPADDIQVGHSTGLVFGQAHVFATLANGDFDVIVAFSPDGGFLSGPVFLGFGALADVNGVNTTLAGFTTESFVDGRIDGSGNLSFVNSVPEPSSMLLLGLGLLGVATVARRRTKTEK